MVTQQPRPRKVMIIRHGEKPGVGVDQSAGTGVSAIGGADDHSLTVRGWQRAGALAVLFAHSRSREGLVVPSRLICPAYPDGIGHRVHQTLEPLADRLGLPIEQLGTPSDPRPAIAGALADRRSVLLCWDHENIPTLAALVPSSSPVPAAWPADRFDLVWVFDRLPGPTLLYSLTIRAQQVLSGDQPPTG